MNHYFFVAIAVQLIWSVMPSASKIVIMELPIYSYIALRWTLSSLAFALVLVLRKEKFVWNYKLALLGVGAHAIASFGSLKGLELGGVSFFSLLTLFSPVLVIWMSKLLLHEKITQQTIAALFFALIGTALMIAGKTELTSLKLALAAAFFVIASQALEILAFLKSRKVTEKLSLNQYLFSTQVSAAAVMWIVCLFFYPEQQIIPIKGQTTVALLFVTFISCVGLTYLWYWLLRKLKGQQMGILTYVHGSSAALIGILLFDEKISLKMILGSLLLLLGIFLSYRQKSKALA